MNDFDDDTEHGRGNWVQGDAGEDFHGPTAETDPGPSMPVLSQNQQKHWSDIFLSHSSGEDKFLWGWFFPEGGIGKIFGWSRFLSAGGRVETPLLVVPHVAAAQATTRRGQRAQ